MVALIITVLSGCSLSGHCLFLEIPFPTELYPLAEQFYKAGLPFMCRISYFNRDGIFQSDDVSRSEFPVTINAARKMNSPVILYPPGGFSPLGGVIPWCLDSCEPLSLKEGWLAEQLAAVARTVDLSRLNYLYLLSHYESLITETPGSSAGILDCERFRRDLAAGRVNSFSFRKLPQFEWHPPPGWSGYIPSDLTLLPPEEGEPWILPPGVTHFISISRGQKFSVGITDEKKPAAIVMVSRFP